MRRSFSRMIQEKERRWSEIKVTAGGRRGDERPLATVQVKRSDLRKRENTAINLYICCYVSKFEIGRLKYKRRYPPEESQREAKPKQRTSNHGRFFFFFFLRSRAPGSRESAGLDNETRRSVVGR